MLAVVFAGLGAGVVITAIGAGSLVSFPILLAVGLPPVTANVCNTVGLVPGGLTGTWGYRSMMHGRAPWVKTIFATSAGGAIVGAILLLVLPAAAFDAVVPALVIFASLLVAVQPLISRHLVRRATLLGTPRQPASRRRLSSPLIGTSSLLGVYGGYFGAGQGVMLVACLAFGIDDDLQVVNALKNVAILSSNVAASVVFIGFADLDWLVIGLVAAGSVVGGQLGAMIGLRLPAAVFRFLVVTMGLLVGIRLLVT